ncbi:MAG TPA: FtsX-like permease family protein [Chitinophagaceae bacterium]|nr:FtsX-like permease family protein [Chitinophagaceae bacterium]
MFKNHFQIALRNIRKRKGYTLLNILGLGIGITCCLLIFQFVSYEKSYESFNNKADQIVRLRLDLHDQGKLTMQSAAVYPGIAPMMKKEFPEVQNYCRLVETRISWLKNEMVQNNIVLANDDRDIKAIENKGYYADQSFLEMFAIQLIKGDPKTSLEGPDKIILSATTAKKYFGQDNATGKKITVREGGNIYYYEVTGIFKDYPANSHLAFDYLISYKTFGNLVKGLGAPKWADPETSLSWYDYYAYLQLRPGTDQKQFQAKVVAFSDRYLNNEYSRTHNNRQDLYIIPLTDIHLYSHYKQEAGVNGDSKSVSFLFLISFLIIIIAWVNYTNLATARSLERAKEVGVRKVLGALRKDLIAQFLTESFLLNVIALLVGIILVFALTPSFNRLMGSDTNALHLPVSYWEGFIFLFFGGAFLSGIYPAFVLSGYHPIAVLKGLFKNSFKGMAIRKGLVVTQFATSIILIAGTIIVYQQVSFMRNQKLGANINETVVLDGPNADQAASFKNAFQPFKNEVLQVNGVKNISASSGVMGKEIYMTNGAYLVNSKEKDPRTFYTLYIDEDFLSAYGMDFMAGRNFSKDDLADKKAVVLTEEAVKLFGIDSPGKALDQLIYNYHDSLKIIGVVKNYHQLGLNKAMLPVIFVVKPDINNFYSIKFQTANTHETIAAIEKIWTKYFPSNPFSYFFLDESFNKQYRSDEQFGKVFGLFAMLAIVIACMGLLSLSAYNVLQRTKEIGIRKTLGASVQHLLFILSKDFLVLVVIGFIVAIPVTWLVMNSWLNDFAFRITINWWVFVIAGLLAVLIALLTVGFHALKAALSNPVKSLRTE